MLLNYMPNLTSIDLSEAHHLPPDILEELIPTAYPNLRGLAARIPPSLWKPSNAASFTTKNSIIRTTEERCGSGFGLSSTTRNALYPYAGLTSLNIRRSDFGPTSGPTNLVPKIISICGPNLTHLDISQCRNVRLIPVINSCISLSYLNVSSTKLDVIQLKTLINVLPLRSIETVDVSSCKHFARALVESDLAASFASPPVPVVPSLRRLHAAYTGVQSQHLRIVGKCFKNLEAVDLRGNWRVSWSCVASLVKECEALVELNVTDCCLEGNSYVKDRTVLGCFIATSSLPMSLL
ncbi:hypothetical protein HK104_008721 [Borealophlyctis nickersoniae]|nr:hypothetical protein HK104_008721 [Borealophlyctis nickersoniae]